MSITYILFEEAQVEKDSFGVRKIGSLESQMVKLRTHKKSHHWS